MHEVTLGEVYRRLEDIDTRHGGALDQINSHLSALNGKVAEHARLHAEHGVKLKNVEREVFSTERKALTRRDLKVAVAVITALGALLRFGPDILRAMSGS